MARHKQSKRVSWAPGVELRQVRLFVSEDAPSQSGFGAQDNLQAKPSWLLHAATGMPSDDSLPPGFETPDAAYQLKKEISKIPLIKWQCPPRVGLNPEWIVAAGEESQEMALENQRQLRVLEAIYPHASLTPPNPFDSSDVQDPCHDDLDTPLIPIIPIDDEEESLDTLPLRSVEQAQCNLIPSSSCSEKPAAWSEPGVEPDVMAAASAAFTAIMRSSEEGSLIDHDLLITILRSPTLIEKLVSECTGAHLEQAQPPSASVSAPLPPIHPSLPPPLQGNLTAPLSVYPRPHNVIPPPVPAVQVAGKPPPAGPPPVKDMSYLKSLVQQHGEERQDAQDWNELGQGMKQRDPKSKTTKACMFFNTPRGCRHGANCFFQHDDVSSYDDVSSLPQRPDRRKGTKKIKLDWN